MQSKMKTIRNFKKYITEMIVHLLYVHPFTWMFWLVLCQLEISKSNFEAETSVEKLSPSNWPVGKNVAHFLD